MKRRSAAVRNVRVSEYSGFMRFLETCYHLSRDLFPREYPHIYRAAADACACHHVIEDKGKLAAHIGVYPIEMVVAGIKIPVAGVGGVATLPELRGKGHMQVLLRDTIDKMREDGFLLSWLAGDRQRYNRYGWEFAGLLHVLTFTSRSLASSGCKSIEMTEVPLAEAYSIIKRLYCNPLCHVVRPHLRQQLGKQGLRFWLCAGGYVITTGESGKSANIVEAVSTSGREVEMIGGVINKTGASWATWEVAEWQKDVLAKALPAVEKWTSTHDCQYKILDLYHLLAAYVPIMKERAVALRNFEVSLIIKEKDREDCATITVEDGDVEISRGTCAKCCVSLDALRAVRLILGGPQGRDFDEVPPGLRALLPLPVHVPALDRV